MRAVIITGKLATDVEVTYPYYRLQEEGYEVHIAIRGKETVLAEKGWKLVPTHDIPEIAVAQYDLLILPGGAKCLEYIRQDMDILRFISDFHEVWGGPIGCICHGAQLLISAGLIVEKGLSRYVSRGRDISGYYSIKDDIINAGGNYIDAPFVTDGNIVTSPHYKHLGPWMKEVLRVAAIRRDHDHVKSV
jgi:protease I